jgi:hypothetical protein
VTVTNRNQTIALTLTADVPDEVVLPEPSTGVWAYGGNLHVHTPHAASLYVYTLSGRLYKQQTVSEGETVIPLIAGIYVVVIEGKTHKIIIQN